MFSFFLWFSLISPPVCVLQSSPLNHSHCTHILFSLKNVIYVTWSFVCSFEKWCTLCHTNLYSTSLNVPWDAMCHKILNYALYRNRIMQGIVIKVYKLGYHFLDTGRKPAISNEGIFWGKNEKIYHSLMYVLEVVEFFIMDFNFDSFEENFFHSLESVSNVVTKFTQKEHVAVRGKMAMKIAENGAAIKIKGEFRWFHPKLKQNWKEKSTWFFHLLQSAHTSIE